MNEPAFMELLAARMQHNGNLARIARLADKARSGALRDELTDEHIRAIRTQLREVQPDEVDPLVRPLLPECVEVSNISRFALFAIDEDALLVVRILVPNDPGRWDWRRIASYYFMGLGYMLVDALPTAGVH